LGGEAREYCRAISQHEQRCDEEDASESLDDTAAQVEKRRRQGDASVHWPQQNIPERGGGDIAGHLDDKDSEGQLVQASLRQEVGRGGGCIVGDIQSVADKALSEHSGNDGQQKKKGDYAAEQAR